MSGYHGAPRRSTGSARARSATRDNAPRGRYARSVDLVVRRPYPSIDAWLREEAHLFTSERAWLVGVDAPPGTTARLSIGLKGDDPLLEATVVVDGVAGDFKGQPLLVVRWLELDDAAIDTLHSLLHVDFHGAAPPSDLVLPPLSSMPAVVDVADVDAMADSIKSEPPFELESAYLDVHESVQSAPVPSFSGDPLQRLRSREISDASKKAIIARGRTLRTSGGNAS
jgi:hypothetical protein